MLRTRAKTLFSCCAPCQLEFGRFVKRWKPDYAFLENVPGMQHVDESEGPLAHFVNLLRTMGYSFDLQVVPALAFGVPQNRERLILMAARDGKLKIPPPTHGTATGGDGAGLDRRLADNRCRLHRSGISG
jgi:site-specific DNA-cytosine methylase